MCLYPMFFVFWSLCSLTHNDTHTHKQQDSTEVLARAKVVRLPMSSACQVQKQRRRECVWGVDKIQEHPEQPGWVSTSKGI